MSLAEISVAGLVLAIALSCFTQVNVGIVSVALAWIIGVYLGGMTVKQVAAGFPVELFLTLAGVTLLFSQAQVNGTLERVARHAVQGCRGNLGALPIMFFFLAAVLASIGPGNIATAALVAPAAMATASRVGISPFLMAIMVGCGANSGSLAAFAPTGIIVNGLMERIGVPGHALFTWWNNFAAHAAVAFGGYFLFGGLRLFRGGRANAGVAAVAKVEPFESKHWITLAVIGSLVLSVVFLKVNIGMAAFTCAAVLALARVSDDGDAIRRMPWSTLMMVSGVTVLIALLEKTQGIDLFAGWMARISTPASVTAVVGFITALVSVYSSTSGVVLPAFLPAVPPLIAKMGGGDVLAIATSMNVSGHLVDVSPLSTIGALCLAGVIDQQESKTLFYKLLAWGLSMCVIGALWSWVFFR